MVKLVYNDPTGMERYVEMGTQNAVVMIGRNPDCAIQTSDQSVSRVHAMVKYKDGKLQVQDPPTGRPTNGTKVDGMRLQAGETLELYAGSELLCGKFKIRIVADGGGDSIAHMGSAAPNPMQYVQQAVQNSADMGKQSGVVTGAGPQGMQQMQQPQLQGWGGQNAAGPKAYSQQSYAQQNYGNYPTQGGASMAMNVGGMSGIQSQAPVGASQVAAVFDQREGSRIMYDPRRAVQPAGGQQPQDDASARGSFDSRAGFDRANPDRNAYDSSRARGGYADRSGKRLDRNTGAGYHPAQNHTASAQPVGVQSAAVQPQPAAPDTRELDELKSQKSALDDEIKELKAKLEDRDREIADYSQRCECHETVTTGLKDMIDKLKEQLDHQKEQNKETKKELVEEQEKNENLLIELSTLKESLESKGMATSNAETTIADLKVQLSQKTRMLAEVQRDLDLAQYDTKAERENVARLEQNVSELNAALEESQRHCRDMKKVVEQHEVKYGDLRSNLEDRADEIRQLQDALRKQGAGDTAALMTELAQTKDILARRTSELDAVRRELSEALTRAETVGGTNGGGARAFADRISPVADSICEDISQWRGDLQSLESSISDLQRVFVPYVRLDVSALQGQDRVRVENMLKEYDPKLIFEDIGNALDMSQSCLAGLKGHIQELKQALSEAADN